jgi:hypothetical protein
MKMKIVLGGSRKLAYVPSEVATRLKSYMDSGAEFFVGDAPGIDTKFQELLNANFYKNVIVHSSANCIRNNLGSWPTRFIDSGLKSMSHARHSAKDRVMTAEADSGVMVWDKESAGTLANVIDLVQAGKPCLLYIAGDNELTNIETVSILDSVLTQYDEVASEAQKRLNAYDRRQNKKVQLNLPESLFD